MNVIVFTAFVFSVLYAVLGNLVVYLILSRRQIPMRFVWAGTPTYLYRVCRQTPEVGLKLRRFAASTDVAFVFAMVLLLSISAMN